LITFSRGRIVAELFLESRIAIKRADKDGVVAFHDHRHADDQRPDNGPPVVVQGLSQRRRMFAEIGLASVLEVASIQKVFPFLVVLILHMGEPWLGVHVDLS
jgi:predicted TIM-barrel fold metal-dependent hydrolase